jgi:phosphoglycerol transferase
MLLAARPYLRAVGWYAANALLTVALMTGVLRLWRAPLDVPFCYEVDGIQTLVFTKTVAETGWYLDNPRLGAPGAMDLRLFPQSEGLHFLILRGLSAAGADPFLALNLFVLACFPLAATTALFVLRRFGCSLFVSALASQLFAFLPYHTMRLLCAGHIFLASYWLVPVAVWIVLRLYRGPDPADPPSPWRRRLAFAAALAFSFVLPGTGVYYAFFYCCFLCLTGVRAVVAERRWAALGAAAALVAATAAGVLANVAPSLPAIRAARAEHPEPILVRTPDHADTFGLRVIQMVLPISDHRVRALRESKARYNDSMAPHHRINENDTASLGALGTAGFLTLLAFLLRRRPAAGRPELWEALAALNLGAVLLGTVGGLGAVVNFAGVLWIRAYTRVSIFIAFFALMVLVLLADRLRRAAAGRWRWGADAALVGVAALALFDQTGLNCTSLGPTLWQESFRSDRGFGRAIEERLPAGSSVFQLPCCSFPEQLMPTGASGYHLAAPYLHTRTLRWSYGANLRQPGWRWQCEVAAKPVPEMLAELRARGFAGVYIDRRGYGDRAQWLEGHITAALGSAPLVSDDGHCSFFPLPPAGPPAPPSSGGSEPAKSASAP